MQNKPVFDCRGAQIPFVKRAPLVTFRKPIGSVSVSGHKFIGAPVPCGVVITRQRYVEALSRRVHRFRMLRLAAV